MRKEEEEVPLFWHLEPALQAKLMQLQYDLHGELLDIPDDPYNKPGKREYCIDLTTEEADKMMRQSPQHQARVE